MFVIYLAIVVFIFYLLLKAAQVGFELDSGWAERALIYTISSIIGFILILIVLNARGYL